MENLKKKTKVNGITLIALVITIIVLLILAGISISMLSGDNALLSRAIQVKEETEKSGEKEIIKVAALDVMTKNKSEKIDEESLKESLSHQTNKNFDIYTTEGKIRVIFTENNTYYDLDSKGNVKYLGKAKKELEIGDYVTYIPPESSYLWDGKYSGEGKDENEDGKIDKTEIKNTDSNYTITKWRVLNINGSKVDLVASEQTIGKVYLAIDDKNKFYANSENIVKMFKDKSDFTINKSIHDNNKYELNIIDPDKFGEIGELSKSIENL